MEPTHAFPVGWCAVRTPHKGCVETHFHTTTISIFSNTISNNFNYPTCLHLSSCWLWRWHDFLSWLVLKCTIPGNKPWEILDDGCGLKDPSFKCSKVLPSCHDGQMEDIDSNCVFQVLKAQVKKITGISWRPNQTGFQGKLLACRMKTVWNAFKTWLFVPPYFGCRKMWSDSHFP